MIGALVLFDIDQAISSADMQKQSELIAPLYQGKPGLLAKHFISQEGGSRVGGFYLWEPRELAEALYTNKRYLSEARQAFGGDPDIVWFDCPVVVDNWHDDLLIETHTG